MQRLFTIQRATHSSAVALVLLLAANAVPLVGVVFLGWDLATIVATYWLENGVVGLFAIGRIATAAGGMWPAGANARSAAAASPGVLRGPQPLQPPPPPAMTDAVAGPTVAQIMRLQRFFLIPFFCVHYGMFWAVHGVFVWFVLPTVFTMVGGPPAGLNEIAGFGMNVGGPAAGPDATVVFAMAIPLLLSHGASFVFNWLGAGEYRSSSPAAEMAAPYARVVILHLTIILGAFGVAILGAPVWAMVVMVALKTAVDLAAHLGERSRAAGRMARAAGGA